MKKDTIFEYFEDFMSTAEMRSIFSDEARIKSWIEVELALIQALHKVGIITQGENLKIKQEIESQKIDFQKLKQDYKIIGFPIVPLLLQLKRSNNPDTVNWAHWGATSQDIIDTGLVIQIKKALDILERDLNIIFEILESLVKKYRNTVMAGRTFNQFAVPTTFGFKASIWLDEMQRHQERLDQMKKRVLVGQCYGAAGTLASFGQHGLEINRILAENLNLTTSLISWHTARDRFLELIQWLTLVTGTVSKIANEIAILMRTEINEVREGNPNGRGVSSTMPQKSNPVYCPWIIANANKVSGLSATMSQSMHQEHERGVSAMPLEWMIIPEAFLLTSSCLNLGKDLLKNLVVDEENMRVNLNLDGGAIMSENVMISLSKYVGVTEAKKIVSRIVISAKESDKKFKDIVYTDTVIKKYFSNKEIQELLEPNLYKGSIDTMIDSVLNDLERRREK